MVRSSTDDPWNYLAVLVNRTSAEGDPDLFGLFTGGPDGPRRPMTMAAAGFDFQDTSVGHRLLQTVAKSDFPQDSGYEGVYLCIRSYTGAVEFSLKATVDRCPASFAPNGAPTMCHTRRGAPKEEARFLECTAEGECICKEPWARPVPETFPGEFFFSWY
jgi:hypothetical protein